HALTIPMLKANQRSLQYQLSQMAPPLLFADGKVLNAHRYKMPFALVLCAVCAQRFAPIQQRFLTVFHKLLPKLLVTIFYKFAFQNGSQNQYTPFVEIRITGPIVQL